MRQEAGEIHSRQWQADAIHFLPPAQPKQNVIDRLHVPQISHKKKVEEKEEEEEEEEEKLGENASINHT